MKSKLWLLQIPIIVFFGWMHWIYESGIQGSLENEILRERIFPKLVTVAGQHTNLKFALRGPTPPKNKIIIIEVDNDSIEHFGRWPWHRDRTASLIQSAFDAGAKHVALDITFSEPDKRIPSELEKHIREKGIQLDLGAFETDRNLETVMAFNQGRITLGWMGATECQPLYHASNPMLCPTDDPERNGTSETMGKFALTSSPQAIDLKQVPFRFVPSTISNLPMYDAVSDHSGFLNITPDPDGYIRKSHLVIAAADGKIYPSLALSTAAAVLGDRASIQLDERQAVKHIRLEKTGYDIPVSPLGLMEIDFRGPTGSFQYVKATQMLSGDEEIWIERSGEVETARKSELFKDAVVLVGVTAIGAFEMRAFPYDSNQPGVEGHANILDNILGQNPLKSGFIDGSRSIESTALLLMMTLGALLFSILISRLDSIPSIALSVLIFISAVAVDQKLLFESGTNLNASIFLIEIAAIFLLTFSMKYVMEERNKKFIRGAFAKYVSPAIIDSIMKDPSKLQVGGEKKDLTIAFSDIRSFTSFSEKMDAKELSNFLNDYLGKMTDIVFETEGTLDKYIGDAVMAFWGAPLEQPKHALNACKAAVLMQKTLRRERPYFREKYGVDVNVGIGLNSGPVSVGNMGSDRIFEYTVIGDHVNLASRLEGLTKEYFSPILTTRFTLDLIQKEGDPLPPHRSLDLVKVKGKSVAVELIQILEEELPSEGLELFASGRKLYGQRLWDQAIECFEQAAKILADDRGEDEISKEFIRRCEGFRNDPPPADWDGAWTMTTK
jgi:adenylate cyclase